MAQPNSPDEFVEKLNAGGFDGHVLREFQKLSAEQLEEVARLVRERGERNGKALSQMEAPAMASDSIEPAL